MYKFKILLANPISSHATWLTPGNSWYLKHKQQQIIVRGSRCLEVLKYVQFYANIFLC